MTYTSKEVKVGKHGFSGSCAPNSGHCDGLFRTFSLGIFEWIPKSNGKGFKSGAVKVRVSGDTNNYEAVKAKAEEIVALLDAGKYCGPKSVKVTLRGEQ